MTYKLYIRMGHTEADAAMITNEDGSMTSFIFDPANTDYQKFKTDVNDESFELQDVDGNTMTTEEVNEFIGTLP